MKSGPLGVWLQRALERVRLFSAALRQPGRKRLLVGLGLAALAIVATLLLNLLFSSSAGAQVPIWLISFLLNLDIVLIVIVLFVLGRSLVKLYLERSRNVLGSRFRTKLVVLAAALVIVPTALMFITATGFLRSLVDRWFSLPVQGMVADAEKVVNTYEEHEQARTLDLARRVGEAVRYEDFVSPRSRRKVSTLVHDRMREYNLGLLAVYNSSAGLVAASGLPDRDPAGDTEVARKAVGELVRGSRETLEFKLMAGQRMLILVGAPILSDVGRPMGAVLAGSYVPQELTAALQGLVNGNDSYRKAKARKGEIKSSFVLMFLFFTIVILFAAVWVGSTLAKGITVPIQKLAEGTRAIAEGRLDYRVDAEVPDELGILVRSFNRMTEQLAQGKSDLERSNLEMRRTNFELENRRRYIETILQNTPSGVISFDPEGRITNINKAALKLLALEDKNHVGMHFRQLLAAKEFLEVRVLIEKMMGVRELSLNRDLHLRLGSRLVDMRVSFTGFSDTQARYMGLVLVIEDLSQLIKGQKVEAWREVAKRIAHEIKNPLTPIRISAERILKKSTGADSEAASIIASCCNTIVHEVDGLKTLVNAFSRFAQMPPISPQPTELARVIATVRALYDGVHPGIHLTFDVAPTIPVLQLDPEQFKRVLTNLIDNAVDAMEGHGAIATRAVYEERSRTVIIEVQDEGPGIDPEHRAKAFIPHFSTKASGRGLGLAIVHRIVSDHNGLIRIEDNEPHGARFVIELPA